MNRAPIAELSKTVSIKYFKVGKFSIHDTTTGDLKLNREEKHDTCPRCERDETRRFINKTVRKDATTKYFRFQLVEKHESWRFALRWDGKRKCERENLELICKKKKKDNKRNFRWRCQLGDASTFH